MNHDWWKHYFPVAAEAQIDGAALRDNAGEASWVAACLRVNAGEKLLDVPCGEGRLSREFAKRGFHVTGVDITPELLEVGRAKAAQQQLTIVFEQRDMRDLPWDGIFDGAFCYFGSFGYFDDLENERFVRAVQRALKPGGRFLIETHIMETLLPLYSSRGWHRVGNHIILEERHINLNEGRIESTWTFVDGGRLSTAEVSIRLYTYRELVALFTRAGFANFEAFDTTSKQPFEYGARRLTFVAQKQ
jgi:SAM-dependent methyltransferase